jgi:hypothetical protein
MTEQRRWPFGGWRIRGGAPVPPQRRSLRAGDGIDEAAIGSTEVGEPGGGQEIARDWGPFPDPLADEEDRRDRG